MLSLCIVQVQECPAEFGETNMVDTMLAAGNPKGGGAEAAPKEARLQG